MQLITQGIQSEFKGMIGVEKIVKMRREIELVDIEAQLIGIDRVLGTGDIVLIAVVPRRDQAVKFIVENMFPFQTYVLVTIPIGGVVVEIEMVLAHVAGEIKAIFFIDLVADVEVDVVEGSPAVFILVGQTRQQPVGIGGPASQDKRGLILHQRAFYIQ